MTYGGNKLLTNLLSLVKYNDRGIVTSFYNKK